MSSSPSVDRFVRNALTIRPRMQAEVRLGVFEAALAVRTSVQRELSVAGVRGGLLRGVGKRGARIGVGFDVKGTQKPTALVRMRGPAHLIERDTRPHTITPRRRGVAYLKTPYGPRLSVQHPGTRGKHPWEKGVTASVPFARALVAKHVSRSYLEAFKL